MTEGQVPPSDGDAVGSLQELELNPSSHCSPIAVSLPGEDAGVCGERGNW